jgi:hypothetical protein
MDYGEELKAAIEEAKRNKDKEALVYFNEETGINVDKLKQDIINMMYESFKAGNTTKVDIDTVDGRTILESLLMTTFDTAMKAGIAEEKFIRISEDSHVTKIDSNDLRNIISYVRKFIAPIVWDKLEGKNDLEKLINISSRI